MYQGHHPDGSGIQLHSAGALYPYTIVVREYRDTDTWEFARGYRVTGPGAEYECPTWEEAIAYAGARRAEWAARNQPIKVERPVIERQAPKVGLEAIIAGQHSVGVRERNGVKTYFVVGPRADQREFETHEQAIERIEFLESDLYSIELQFNRRQSGWNAWAAGRNQIR